MSQDWNVLERRWLEDTDQLEKLNAFCEGKSVREIRYEDDVYLTICFSDGSHVMLSFIGGGEIERFFSNDTSGVKHVNNNQENIGTGIQAADNGDNA